MCGIPFSVPTFWHLFFKKEMEPLPTEKNSTKLKLQRETNENIQRIPKYMFYLFFPFVWSVCPIPLGANSSHYQYLNRNEKCETFLLFCFPFYSKHLLWNSAAEVSTREEAKRTSNFWDVSWLLSSRFWRKTRSSGVVFQICFLCWRICFSEKRPQLSSWCVRNGFTKIVYLFYVFFSFFCFLLFKIVAWEQISLLTESYRICLIGYS